MKLDTTGSTIELGCPAIGVQLKNRGKDLGIVKKIEKRHPSYVNAVMDPHTFGDFGPLMIGAERGKHSSEIRPHPEMEALFFQIIDEYKKLGIFTTYLDHGYAVNRMKSAKEMPGEVEKAIQINYYMTGKLIDNLSDTDAQVIKGIGPALEGLGRNSNLKINGVPALFAHKSMSVGEYAKYYYKYLEPFKDFDMKLGIQETAYNTNEIHGLAKAFESIGMQVMTSYYARKDGMIPDIQGDKALHEMLQNNKQIDNWEGGSLNCVTREVAEDEIDKLLALHPELMQFFIGLRTNGSAGAYENDYNKPYPEELSSYMNRMKMKNKYLTYITGCCGHVGEELCGVFNSRKPKLVTSL